MGIKKKMFSVNWMYYNVSMSQTQVSIPLELVLEELSLGSLAHSHPARSWVHCNSGLSQP